MTAEQQLACEVLLVAWHDAMRRTPPGHVPSEVAEARLFCLDRYGAWARAREVWCDAAGICPDRFRAAAQHACARPTIRKPPIGEPKAMPWNAVLARYGRFAAP